MKRLTNPSRPVILVAGLVLILACGGEGAASTTPPTESTSTTEMGTQPTTTVAPETGSPEIPTVPADYATAVFDAWASGDQGALETLTSAAAFQVLAGRPADDADQWTHAGCEGAAGSTYCSWTGTAETLVLRVGNEDASQGRQHAVFEARFETSD